jgi:ELWxxDGT repeat protein
MDSTGNHDSLWKSDGTRDGTVLVKDGFDTPIGSVGIHEMTNVNGTLFFAYSDAYKTDGLWKSDGTSAGTVQVRPDLAGVDGLVNVNGKLVFTSEDRVPATDNGISLGWKKAIGQDLWITDGTDNGTVFLKHSSSIGFGPPINVNGSIYIFELNYELLLWKSDGTVAGTHLVRSFSDLNTIDNSLADVNGTLYFISRGPSQYALWKSDGTEAGTVLIEELGTEDFYYGSQLTNVNGTLYFSDIYETAQGTVSLLWRSDGTEVGTTIVPETNLNPSFSLLWQLTSVNGNLFFVDLANSGTTNTQGLIVGKVDTGDGSPSSPVDLSSLDAKTISDPPPDPGLVLPPFYPPYKAVPDSFSALLIPPPQDPEPSQPKSEVGKMDVSNIQVSLAVTNSAGPVANQSNGSQSIDSIQAPAQSSSLLTNSSGLTNASSNSVDLVQVRAQKSNGIAADDEISTADLDSLFALAAIDPEIALQRD